MANESATSNSYFNSAKRISLFAFWGTFAVNEVYAIVSFIAFSIKGKAVESGAFITVMAFLVVIMGPLLVLSMVMIHLYAKPEKKCFSLTALIFMGLCIAITTCINFLLFIVNSHQNLFSEALLSMFLPCRWPTPAFILDNFVWDWFFGISMLFIAPVFSSGEKDKWLRFVLNLSGVFCIVGTVLLAIVPSFGVIVGIIGWGAFGPIAFLLCAKLFTKTTVDDWHI